MLRTPKRSREGGAIGRALQEIADAFRPPALAGRPWRKIISWMHRVRVMIGISSLGVVWTLPTATPRQRAMLAALVGGVYLPYAFLILRLSRRRDSPAVRLGGIAGDLLIVFLFAALLPPTRVVAVIGFLLITAVHASIGGLWAGLIPAVGGIGLLLGAERLRPDGLQVDAYTLTMYGVAAVGLSLLLDVSMREQRRTLSALHESEGLLYEAQQIARVGSWTWDLGSGRVWWSDELYRIHGYEPGAFPVTFERAVEQIVPEDRERINADLEEAFRAGVDHEFPGTDYRIVLPTGDERICIGRGKLTVGTFGEPQRLVGTVQDVTELRRSERELERAYERERQVVDSLREADRLKQELVSGVSHEFRTPLTAIRGFTETLLRHSEALHADAARDLLERIDHNAAELTRLVEQFLDHSRVESGWQEFNQEVVDLGAWLAAFVRGRAPALARHRVVSDVPGELPIRADATALDRVVGNLLDNAVKFSPAGSEIRISARTRGEEVVISVTDQGHGVAPEHRTHIFEAFYQEPGRRTRPGERGAGLGLAVARRFVELHGGRIWVEPANGQGATFSFTVPAAAGNRAAS